MFLTVAIPVYNEELYLSNCIESILTQSMKDFEILLVNDGSTDNTAKICDAYAKNYPEMIRVIHCKHQGSLLIRRCCLENARGEFIHFMDADDMLVDKDAYKKIRTAYMEEKGDFFIFRFKCNAGDKIINKQDDVLSSFYNKRVFEEKAKEELQVLFLNSYSLNFLWNKVFKRSLVDYHEDYSRYGEVVVSEDLIQMLPVFTKAKKIVFIDEVFYYYRLHKGSQVRKFDFRIYGSLKKAYNLLEKYLAVWNLSDNERFIKLFGIKKLNSCISAANKVRYCDTAQKKEAMLYLKEIATDSFFLDAYKSIDGLSTVKKIIAFMLKNKAYNLIWFGVRLQNLYRL